MRKSIMLVANIYSFTQVTVNWKLFNIAFIFRSGAANGIFLDYFRDIYIKPYSHAPPYIIGMVLGCVVFRNIDKKFQLKLVRTLELSVNATLLKCFGIFC